MEKVIPILEITCAVITLLAATIAFLNARSSRESKNSAKSIEENIKKIKSEMIGNIINKNKIAAIAEIKSKTEVLQKTLSKYQRGENLVGYDTSEDLSELDKYMSEIKEKNWIFENEGINIADRLYDDLNEISNKTDQLIDAVEMRKLYLLLKPKLENYKSVLSKISNQNIIN